MKCPTTHVAVIWPMSFLLVWGTTTTKRWLFQLLLVFTVYVSTQLAKSRSASLYPYQSNQSGCGLGLCLVLYVWDWQTSDRKKKKASFLFILWCLWGKSPLLDSLSENIQIHVNPLWRNPDMVQTHCWDLTQPGPCWHTCTLKLLAICYRGTGCPCNAFSWRPQPLRESQQFILQQASTHLNPMRTQPFVKTSRKGLLLRLSTSAILDLPGHSYLSLTWFSSCDGDLCPHKGREASVYSTVLDLQELILQEESQIEPQKQALRYIIYSTM